MYVYEVTHGIFKIFSLIASLKTYSTGYFSKPQNGTGYFCGMTLLLWNDSIAWKCGWLWLSMAELSICWHPRTLASFTSHLSGEHSHRTFNNELKWVAEIKTKYFYLLFDYSFFGLFPSRNCRPQLNWIFPIQKNTKMHF